MKGDANGYLRAEDRSSAKKETDAGSMTHRGISKAARRSEEPDPKGAP